MATSQATDPQTRSLQSSPSSTLVVEPVTLSNSNDPLYCGVSTGNQRPLVPLTWRRTVFESLHGLSHPGIRATQKLITARFVWPGINSDVRRWTRSCLQCQRAKVQRHTHAPLSTFPNPDARYDVIHIDLVEPLPPSQGFTYLLTCVDRFTRWPQAILLTSITAESVAQAFLAGWISALVYPLALSQIADDNSNPNSRTLSCLYSVPNAHEPPPITLRPMAWSNASIAKSKLLSKHNFTLTPGWIRYPSSSSAFGLCGCEGRQLLQSRRDGLRYYPPPPWRILHHLSLQPSA